MILASLAEIISVSAVLPFLSVLTAPDHLYQQPLVQPIIQYLELESPDQLLLPFTILFIAAAIVAGVIRLLLLFCMTRISYATGADLSINIYRRTLYQEYSIHVSRNSSEVINGIITKTGTVISGVVGPALTIVSSSILITAIIFALLVINPEVAMVAFVSFTCLYWLVIKYSRKRLFKNSQTIANQSTQMIKSLQEGLGGIRDVLIDGSQQFYSQLYRNSDLPLRRAAGENIFIAGSPRFIMEAIGMVMIATLAYGMSMREGALVSAIPVLGALALGAQRLLPALQQAYSAYSVYKGSQASFQDVISLLDQPIPEYADGSISNSLQFENDIKLVNLGFRYSKDSEWVLNKINLSIPKGGRIGFLGKTGSGKSTLLDIIMGLLWPSEGQFFVDGQLITLQNRRSWQAHIAHVPQNIYLADSPIAENIAFGVPPEKIDYQLVKKAAEQAQISELISNWPMGYQTYVGEQGAKLSGGQRQRIGIARAFYKKAKVLIFDEATSALDNETEQAVMDVIDGLGRELTILIIAHRSSTLKGCDQVVKLTDKGIIIGKYNE